MSSLLSRFAFFLALAICPVGARAEVGADTPWTTYEAEDMKSTGTVLGPKYEPFLVETESSGQKCVKLAADGQYVEFVAQSPANAMVIRYNLPDSEDGSGIDSTINLFQNGKMAKSVPVTSRYSWIYGRYPFTNNPKDGKPRNFYNEARLQGLTIRKGDIIRLQKADNSAPYCVIDLVDLEDVAPPLRPPANSLSVMDFGVASGGADNTAALRKCVAEAQKRRKTVWVPPGEYKLAGEIIVPSDVTIQGAGMWYTTFVGDEKLYGNADKRVRIKLTGNNIHLADFAIIGRLNYRNDNEPNDGIIGAICSNSAISHVWVEHTKIGAWIYNGAKLVIEGCRFRNLLADGVNFCVGT